MSEHIHLSVPRYTSKKCKIAKNEKKIQTIEIQSYCKENWNKAWQMFAWFIAHAENMIINNKRKEKRMNNLSL